MHFKAIDAVTLRFCMGILCASVSCATSLAEVTLTVTALRNVVPSGYARVESSEGSLMSADISLGDPLGLSLALTNESDHKTDPMPVALNPRANTTVVVIRHPDGHKTLSPLDQPNARTRTPIRPMEPHERLMVNVYAYTDAAAEIDGRAVYLFPSPGEYKVFVAYYADQTILDRLPDDAAFGTQQQRSQTRGERLVRDQLKIIREGDGVLTSNTIRVNVGPPFPGWEELKAAGIIGAVRTGSIAAINPTVNQEWRSEIDRFNAMVDESGRPWLTEFYRARKEAVLREVQR